MSSDPALLTQATAHLQAGRFPDCEQLCRQVLASDPKSAEAYRLLASVAYFQNDYEESGRMLQQAIQLRPDVAEYYDNLATLLTRQGRPADAEQAARRGLAATPSATLYQRLGEALRAQSQFGDAAEAYRRAVEMNPQQVSSWFSLASSLASQGKLGEAEAAYRQVLTLEPDTLQALVNLGNVLQSQERFAEALPLYRQAMAINPNVAATHYNTANAFKALGKLTDAMLGYEHALRLGPPSPEAHLNLGGVHLEQGRLDAAMHHFRSSLAIEPTHAGAHDNLLLASQYLPDVTLPELARLHAQWNQQMAEPLHSMWRPHANSRERDRPLKLGFTSADMGRHPVGYFIARILEALDRGQFSTVCYSDRATHDDVSQRIAAACTTWRDTRYLSDEALAQQVREDQVDILFDLSGHTHGNRLLMFAGKPAPLAVSWLGYVGTTGLAAMDYLITDSYMVPPGAEEHYREKILRLPGGSTYCEPPAEAPAVGPLPALARGSATFASFNNPAKVSTRVVAAWSDILRRVPGSRLLLKHRAWDDRSTRDRYVSEFAVQGIDASRLDLRRWTPLAEMLAEYNEVDIALDPFPYTGGSTSWLALWMGVPVVTCPGETVASRQTLSLLSHAGATELVASDLAGYVDLATSLSGDLPRLSALRAGLRERMAASSLCNLDRFVAEFSAAIRGIWHSYCGDEPRQRDAEDMHLL